MIGAVLIGIFLCFAWVYYLCRRKYDYWEKKKIPYLKPVPFLGNYGSYILMQEYIGEVAQKICQKHPKTTYFGAFFGTEPALMLQDPELIKIVLRTDFSQIYSRENSNYTDGESLLRSIFFATGDWWKLLRQHWVPLFSSSKLKGMFNIINECIHKFDDMLEYELDKNDKHDLRQLVSRFSMQCSYLCAFGLDPQIMEKDIHNNPFINITKLIFKKDYMSGFKTAVRAIWPAVFYGLGLTNFPKKLDIFIYNLISKVFNERQHKQTNRGDFADMLLQVKSKLATKWNENGNVQKTNLQESTDNELVAQCFAFFLASTESIAVTLTYVLYELAKNQKVQNRAIKEVDEYMLIHNNKIDLSCTSELPYLDACVDEALRLYPVVGLLRREVMDKYTLPCGAVLDKGVRIHIPVYHLHRNPDLFPEPEEYLPERFIGDNRLNIKPCSYLPFGDGPRICPGRRFAKIQIYSILLTILKKYRLEVTDDTPMKLEFYPTTMITQYKQNLSLKLVKRKNVSVIQ